VLERSKPTDPTAKDWSLMTEHEGPSRRRILTSLGVAAAGAAITVAGPAGPAQAKQPKPPAETDPSVPEARTWNRATTQNGWPVVGSDTYKNFRVEGTAAVIALRPGPAATVLTHVVRRFHYEISALKSGDVFGYTTDHSVAAPYESNYLSGTAVAILPGLYPAGSSGNLYPLELTVVRDILAECQGVVRWGGDDASCPKEGHFQLDVPPGTAGLTHLAATLNRWRTVPGKGAGTAVDPFAASRVSAARALERSQRSA
jgi:hypothetical protein